MEQKNVISLKPLRLPLGQQSEEEHFEERSSVLMAEAVYAEIGSVREVDLEGNTPSQGPAETRCVCRGSVRSRGVRASRQGNVALILLPVTTSAQLPQSASWFQIQ